MELSAQKNVLLEEELRSTAQVLLDLLRKRCASRRVRVLVFAQATRVALDALPLEQRGLGFVLRTWDLPEFAAPTQEVLRYISDTIDHLVTLISARVVLLSRATQLAIDDLSPDEQISALAEATQIIGSPPLQA